MKHIILHYYKLDNPRYIFDNEINLMFLIYMFNSFKDIRIKNYLVSN